MFSCVRSYAVFPEPLKVNGTAEEMPYRAHYSEYEAFNDVEED